MRRLLKSLWRATPQPVREFGLRLLCSFALDGVSEAATSASGPCFIVGSLRAVGGLARGARLHADELRGQGVEVVPVDMTREMLQTPFLSLEETGALPLDAARRHAGPGTVILHLNPPQFQVALLRLGRDFLRGKRIYAYWAWELESLPRVWLHALRFAHGIFVPSVFVQRTVSHHTHKPVWVRPHPVPAAARCKEKFMVDGVLRCLFLFDMASSAQRKNPAAVIEAFRMAFAPGEAMLTLKVGQPEADRDAYRALVASASQVPGVKVRTEALGEEELDALYLEHDVYVSLHRSEGYGLTIREAMLRGLYVVATGWSGNMDFMQGDRCFPVPFRLVAAPVGALGLDHAPCRWAEPDVSAAAELLRGIRAMLATASTGAH